MKELVLLFLPVLEDKIEKLSLPLLQLHRQLAFSFRVQLHCDRLFDVVLDWTFVIFKVQYLIDVNDLHPNIIEKFGLFIW